MSPDNKALVEAAIVRDQQWAYDRRIVDGLSWQQIRYLGVRPLEHGGIGRDLSIGSLKGMVAAHRSAQGEIVGTRDERIERRQLEIDELARLARNSVARADAAGKLDATGARLLLDARAAEAKMHGDDTPAELVVTHRDAVLDDLNAALAAMGEAPIERADHA
jgi:hypothetical protein